MNIFLILQLVISVLLVVAVLFQSKGSGIGVVGGDFSGSYHTKRGFEKFLTRATVVLGFLFIVISIVVVWV